MTAGTNSENARALLQWYALAGVDETVGEVPVDRFATPSVTITPSVTMKPVQAPGDIGGEVRSDSKGDASQPIKPDPAVHGDPVLAARRLAAKARTLGELEDIVRDFDGCLLRTTAKTTCFADGSPEARVMFIGEAPGRDEDLSGTPFVGRAGQLLDKMLAAIGRDRKSVYITNIVYWRPPGNRNPTPLEASICRPFTEAQIALLRPKVLVFLGGSAAKQMLNTSTGIMRLRGKWSTYTPAQGEPIKAMATLHPAFLLRQPGQKKLAWKDFQNIRHALEEMSG